MSDAATLRERLVEQAGSLALSDVGEKRLLAEFLLPLARAAGGAPGRDLGDDAAVLATPPGHELLVSGDRVPTDLLARQFGLMSAEAFGRYVVRVNVSDIAAMAGDPFALFLTAAFPPTTELRRVLDLMWGIYDESMRWGCPLVGGDTKSATEESISATVLGTVPAGQALRRGPLSPADELYVSGALGTAGAALRWLGAAQRGDDDGPDTLTRAQLVGAVVEPIPRVDLSTQLRATDGLTAGMDITDGLGQSLVELAEGSGVGILVQEDAIPLSEPARRATQALHLEPAELVGGIGNDLELLLAAVPGTELLFPATRIGVVTAAGGVRLASHDGTERPFPVSGFEHFKRQPTDYLARP